MTDTPKETKFRLQVRELIARGVMPTPLVLSNLGYGSINGPLSKIRREELAAAGYVQDTPGGRWYRRA